MVANSRVPRGYNTTSDSMKIRNNSIYLGFIKENSDAQRMGRLKVWIPELGSSSADDPNGWIIVSYASMFAGATNPADVNGSSQTMSGSQQSYGWWGIPPDINNQVLVCFVNGEISRGYWFACVYQQNMNHMIPGIACNIPTTQTAGNTYLPPVVEYNKINQTDPDNPRRPPFTPLANGLVTEGLQADPERGPSSTSARREAPSAVFGYLTPRGNTIHVDDNPENEFIRLRTRSGTQILIDETTGMVYINSKLGNAWLEVSDAGVDVYSANSVSIRAQQDFNVRADRNIIFDAGGSILLKAAQDVNIQSANDIVLGSGNQLVLSSVNNTSLTVGSDFNLSVSGDFATQTGGNLTESVGADIVRNAINILDNSGNAPNVNPNVAVVPQPKNLPDIQSGALSTLESIVSRMPTHEPASSVHPAFGVPLTSGEADFPPNQGQGSAGGATGTVTKTVATGTGNQNIKTNLAAGCQSGVSTVPVPTESWNAIKAGSAASGADFGTMAAIAQVESGFQPNAYNPSSATGMFQFEGRTWTEMVTKYGSQYNLSEGNITDPVANATAGGLYANQNAQTLSNNGVANSSSAGNLYLSHLLGPGGATTVIDAVATNPNAPISSLPSGTYNNIQNNPSWLNGNQSGVNLGSDPTVGDYYNNLTGHMNALASAYDSQAGLPAPCDRQNSTSTSGTTGASTNSTTSATGASSTGAAIGVLGSGDQ